MENENIKKLNIKRTVLYNSGQTPPKMTLILSSLQHMILLLSMGVAVPVTIAREAGLDICLSAALLAASLFATGLASVLQTSKMRYCGSGFMTFAAVNSAALSACIIAAKTGGIPLVMGMTVFSGILRFVLGSFTYKLRRFFPAELTGTMIFILGISLVPTALENFLGNAGAFEYNSAHLVVALSTFVVMIICTLFIKPLKPYTALVGIVFGFILSAVTGVFDVSSLKNISDQAVLSLPIYPELSYSFDSSVLIPFVVISVATVIDNIGDFSASQSADNPNFKKADWKSVEGGIRAGALGNILSGLIGGSMLTTSTANIGISSAGGITSRKVAYLAGIMLMVLAFFPGITSIFALIPTPVLGAVLLYSGCYIMAGGFSILSDLVIDDRRTFSVFLSIIFAISTLVPGLYSFLPKNISDIFISPMVMGVCMLLITTMVSRIGTKKVFSFESGVSPENIIALNEEIENVCRQNGSERKLMRKLQVSMDSLCESIYEMTPDAALRFTIFHDSHQLRIHVESTEAIFPEKHLDFDNSSPKNFDVCLMILKNIFDNVETKISDCKFVANMKVDL